MSTILFPAGLSIDFHNLNMEEMEFYSRAWNLQRMQMQKGLFNGSLIVTHTPRVQLMKAPYSHGVLMQGDFPKGTVLIAAVVTKADISFQNSITDKHEIRILKSGDEIDFLCNGNSETFTVAVEEKFFDTSHYNYFGKEFSTDNKNRQVYIEPKLFDYFIKGIEKYMSYLMQNSNPLKMETHYDNIELEIMEHIFSCIYLKDSKKLRQKFQIKKARNLIHDSIEEINNISTLAKELGISERLLHHSFKENYGITPKKYLFNLQMNKIKKELILADSTATISSIAQKYNFYNHSTFTQAYKNMFRELPTTTLNKSF